MTRLTRVELRRVLSRRMVQVCGALMLLVVGLAVFGVYDATRDLAGQRAEAQVWYEQAVEDWEENGEQMVADCLEAEQRERELSGDDALDFGCEAMTEPRLEDFLVEPQSLAGQSQELLGTVAYPVLFLALLIGATSTAAEFATRAVGTWLTFEPRRDRVFGSKVLAAALGTVPLAVAFVALVLLGTVAVFRLNGVDTAVSGQEWTTLAWTAGRIVLVMAVVGAVGAAAGTLLRHTAAVLGVLLGYLAVGELVLRSLLPRLERYLLSVNLDAWIDDGTEWVTYDCPASGGNCVETMHSLSLAEGATLLGVLTAVLVVVSWLVFRRADID